MESIVKLIFAWSGHLLVMLMVWWCTMQVLEGNLASVGTHLEVLVKHCRIESVTQIINEPPNNFYSKLQCMCLLCRQILVLLLLFLHSAVHTQMLSELTNSWARKHQNNRHKDRIWHLMLNNIISLICDSCQSPSRRTGTHLFGQLFWSNS